MSGLAPKLPISRDDTDGIKLIKRYSELATQNLKMLVLTAPNDRDWETGSLGASPDILLPSQLNSD